MSVSSIDFVVTLRVPNLESTGVADDDDVLVDPAFLAGIGGKHDAAGLVDLHVLRKRLELQHDVPALALGGVLLLDERIEQLGDPCLEIGRFEHVKAFVVQIAGDDELG